MIATSNGAAARNARGQMTNLRLAMFLGMGSTSGALVGAADTPPRDAIADRLQLHSSYVDQSVHRDVPYRVSHTRLGLALMWLAGVMSGLLGIGSGSGVLKIPAMDLAMRLPMKVSSATTNFMIGVTATASAGVCCALLR